MEISNFYTKDSMDEDTLDCRKIMASGSKSFYAASRLFPSRLRGPATVIYTYCRLADDMVDEGGNRGTITELKMRLKNIYNGKASNDGIDKSFQDVVKKYNIPIALPMALIEGFDWDMSNRRYNSITDLTEYAIRVAGSVGAMISVLMGVSEKRALVCACRLGIGMQFTNIARDVGEDARNGRLYLPQEWMQEVGINSRDWLKSPRYTPEIAKLVKRLLFLASQHYLDASKAIFVLPKDCKLSIMAARYIYEEIGNEIKRNNFDSVNFRAHVSLTKKLFLIAKSFKELNTPFENSRDVNQNEPPYLAKMLTLLVDPIIQQSKGKRCSTMPLSFLERLDWVIQLFLKLSARDKYQLIDSRHSPRQ